MLDKNHQKVRWDINNALEQGGLDMSISNDGTVVIIKKYANRRLYCTSTSTYITLETLADLVRRGIEFEVQDAKTGEDLTRQILTQIIFERENKGEGALPVDFLRQLISFYGGGSQSMLPTWLDMSMNSFAEWQKNWSQASEEPAGLEVLFAKQIRTNAEIFERTMKMFASGGRGDTAAGDAAVNARPTTSEPSRGGPAADEDAVASLKVQLERMQDQLNALTNR